MGLAAVRAALVSAATVAEDVRREGKRRNAETTNHEGTEARGGLSVRPATDSRTTLESFGEGHLGGLAGCKPAGGLVSPNALERLGEQPAQTRPKLPEKTRSCVVLHGRR